MSTMPLVGPATAAVPSVVAALRRSLPSLVLATLVGAFLLASPGLHHVVSADGGWVSYGTDPGTSSAYVLAATVVVVVGVLLGRAHPVWATVLVLLLLGFAGIGAANAVVLATTGRRDELLLLRRTGATRRQLLATTGTEALVTGAVAWLIGAAAVVPAVAGMTLGLLGPAVPAVDLRVVGALSLVVVAIPVVGTLATVARAERLGGPGGDDHGRPTTSRGIVGRADDEEVSR
ncbi:FtsX-like permease family protein [Cellulomonas septica]|uniref:ABC3 transporter permease C-terminal domain-containing protein n=1 Tax=Cellulomonas septica TaxID=285080 RepID=A0ABX1K354_9CELL|nr:FtsX-like permease family protein [Cellulomonas septica]NKY40988.1 hypothetical protein [Cellulomonas septica]